MSCNDRLEHVNKNKLRYDMKLNLVSASKVPKQIRYYGSSLTFFCHML